MGSVGPVSLCLVSPYFLPLLAHKISVSGVAKLKTVCHSISTHLALPFALFNNNDNSNMLSTSLSYSVLSLVNWFGRLCNL